MKVLRPLPCRQLRRKLWSTTHQGSTPLSLTRMRSGSPFFIPALVMIASNATSDMSNYLINLNMKLCLTYGDQRTTNRLKSMEHFAMIEKISTEPYCISGFMTRKRDSWIESFGSTPFAYMSIDIKGNIVETWGVDLCFLWAIVLQVGVAFIRLRVALPILCLDLCILALNCTVWISLFAGLAPSLKWNYS
jgi:hypothetical protein